MILEILHLIFFNLELEIILGRVIFHIMYIFMFNDKYICAPT